MHNLPTLDRKTYRLVRAFVLPFEYPALLALIGAIVLIVLGWVLFAHASCNTIPERQDALCRELGFSPPCEFASESGARMTLVLTTTDSAHEPLSPGTGQHATAVSLLTRRAAAAEVYQRASDPAVAPQLGADAFMNPALSGLNESDVTCEHVLAKLLWQSDVREMGEQLRTIYGRTGWPYIARTYDHTCIVRHDGTADDSSTTVSLDVRVDFATPR